MSGGTAYVLDMNHDLYLRLNKQLVSMTEVSDSHDIELVKDLIQRHAKETGSELAKKILKDFDNYIQE